MNKNIKYIIFSTLLSILASMPAIAADEKKNPVADESCSIAFDNEGNVLKDSYVICRQDVALNAMVITIGAVINDSPAIRGVFNKLRVPIPNYSEIVKYSSKPVAAVATASVQISLILITFFSAVKLWGVGQKLMKESDLGEMAKNPDSYKAFLGFSLVAALAYRVGDVSVAQILVVGAGLVALSATTFLFTSMIAVFDFSSDPATPEDDFLEFVPQGEIYASGLMASIYGAQNAAIMTNFVNVAAENASMVRPDYVSDPNQSYKDTAISWLLSVFSGFSDQDPTAQEYFDGVFGDSFLTLHQSSGLKSMYRSNHGASNPNNMVTVGVAKSNLSVFDGRASDGTSLKTEGSIFERSHRYWDLFSANSVLSLTSTLPDIEADVFRFIAKSEAINKMGELLNSDGTTDVSVGAKSAQNALYDLIKEVIELYPEVQPAIVVSVVQSIALGSVSSEAAASGKAGISKRFSPFISGKQFKAQYSKEPFNLVFAEALKGTKNLHAYNCLKNFSDTSGEFLLLNAIKADNDGWGATLKNLYSGGDVFPICIYPTADDTGKYETLAPKDMHEAAMKLAKTNLDTKSDNADLASALSRMYLGETLGSKDDIGELSKALYEVQKVHENITNYYARVGAVGRGAALKYIKDNQEDYKSAFLRDLRLQGALAISSYFMQLSNEQDKYSDIIYNSSPKVKIETVIQQDTGLPLQTGKLQQDTFSDKRKYLNFNQWDVVANIMTDNVNFAAMSMRGDDVGDNGEDAVNELVAELADMIIPSQDILMSGFGLEGDTFLESMQSCTTTTSCVEFKQHPLATISIFGKDMLHTGMFIVVVNSFIQGLNDLVNDETTGSGEGIFASIGGLIKGFVLKHVGTLLKIVAAISGILAVFGGVFIFAGIFVGYIVPLMPFVSQLMMWIVWLAEFLILFLVVPILVALSFISKEDGSPLFKPTSIISMVAAVILKAPLIFISFMIFYSLSYGGIYIINSTMFTLFSSDFNPNAGIFGMMMQIVSSVVFFVFVVAMYFLMFKNLTKMMSEMPDYVMKPMGVESFNVQVSTGVESFVMAAAMQKKIEDILKETGGSVGRSLGGAMDKTPPPPPTPPSENKDASSDKSSSSSESGNGNSTTNDTKRAENDKASSSSDSGNGNSTTGDTKSEGSDGNSTTSNASVTDRDSVENTSEKKEDK